MPKAKADTELVVIEKTHELLVWTLRLWSHAEHALAASQQDFRNLNHFGSLSHAVYSSETDGATTQRRPSSPSGYRTNP